MVSREVSTGKDRPFVFTNMRMCEVCKSTNRVCQFKKSGPYLCNKHSRHIQRHGKILTRTIYDKNEIVDCGNYAEMILYNKEGEETARTKIDKNQIKRVSKYKWNLGNKRYVRCIKLKTQLHNFVLGKKKGYHTDHKSGDRLDNRVENLRIVTVSQNQWNRNVLHRRNKSGYNGVFWDSVTNSWAARICCFRKQIWLGRHKNKSDAIKARLEAEQKYFGEFAPTKRAA